MREFWIIEEKGYSTWVSDKPLHSADTTAEIHVIEKLSYDALAAKLAIAVEALEEISTFTQVVKDHLAWKGEKVVHTNAAYLARGILAKIGKLDGSND